MRNYFTLPEFLRSERAKKMGIDNFPSFEVVHNLELLRDKVLNPLREAYGAKIAVTSGYRCPRLNAAVNGAVSSQHMLGQAADIRAMVADSQKLFAENRRIFELVQELKLPFDQLINEYNFSWLHLSYSPRHRRQILNVI